MMECVAKSKLSVVNPSQELIEWCRENLCLPNPEYYKRKAMGRWVGNTPEYFDLYERIGIELLMPFGCSRALRDKFGSEMRFKGLYGPIRRVDYRSSINLYPYQEAAVEAAEALKNGIIVMPCGSGKTQTALELIARIGGRTLWLTHTQDLLNQSLNRAKSVLGVDDWTYGTITGGKVNIGVGITFATVQTMAKLDLSEYEECWDVVVVDECHKAVGSPTRVMQFYKVLSGLSCRYKFGLTATPKRADGFEKSMFALLGDIVYEVSRDDVSDTTCPVHVEWIETGYKPNMGTVLAGDGTINYSALVDDLTHDSERHNCVLSAIDVACALAGGYTLVLANRVEYLSRLTAEFEAAGVSSICLSSLSKSKANKALRKQALNALNNGEIKIIFATYQLAKEGLDVPNLRYVVLATPEKDDTTVTQAAGRVGRKSIGKDYGTIIDFVDDFGMLRGWAKKRKNYYRKLGYLY